MSETLNLQETRKKKKAGSGYFVWISWLKDRVRDSMHRCERSSCFLGDSSQQHKGACPKMEMSTGRQGCHQRGGSGGHWPAPKYWPSQWLPLARLSHVGNNFNKLERKTERDSLQ